ncbi:MAG: hypothetical protein HYS07_02255 [Chlamydiae bacterium]|nr:hypothetical protein [Chlamydiota bacterium]MBI3276729.1 hypothetical protein [Chlamydiota bacterium]
MRKKRNLHSQGLLLIEALLSVVILSVAVSAAIRAFAYSAKVDRLTKDYLALLPLAEEKMSLLEAEPHLDEGETSEKFDKPYSDFSWQAHIRKIHKNNVQMESEEKEETVEYFNVSLEVKAAKGMVHGLSLDTILVKKKEDTEEKDENNASASR